MIDAQTKLFGVIGQPLGHSLSPYMHNEFMQTTGVNGCYLAFPLQAQQLKQGIEGLFALGVGGCNVTIPYKEAVIAHTVALTPIAQFCGAVNTLIPVKEGFIGDNTDGGGLLSALADEHHWTARDQHIMVIGAGGAAKGIVGALALAKARQITIINRSLTKAVALANLVESISETKCIALGFEQLSQPSVYDDADVLINTTSLGMYPHVHSLPPIYSKGLESLDLVVDIVYNPLETALLRQANNLGVKTSSGLGMFIQQGALAFERWTGIKPETEHIREKLIQRLSMQQRKT